MLVFPGFGGPDRSFWPDVRRDIRPKTSVFGLNFRSWNTTISSAIAFQYGCVLVEGEGSEAACGPAWHILGCFFPADWPLRPTAREVCKSCLCSTRALACRAHLLGRRHTSDAHITQILSVATPAEPRGEFFFFFCANFGRWKTFKIRWKVPVEYF